jgi:ethylbenzene dioxygenase subunit beta
MPMFLGDSEVIAKPKVTPEKALPARELVYRIEQFLYREARLLDEERYEEWLGLMTPDVHYYMPGIVATYRRDRRRATEVERAAHFDDDLFGMRRRVTRFLQNTAWTEDPPTRCVRVIGGIEVEPTEVAREYTVHSTFTNCRGRNDRDEDILYGRRFDLLREVEGSLRIARRHIRITQAVLLSKNLNIFL